MARRKTRVRKAASPSKAQIYFSKEQTVKQDDSCFLLDWLAGCEALPVRIARVSSVYEQELVRRFALAE